MNSPSIVVGVVTRNRAPLLPKALDSVLRQRGYAVRLSVIDDDSNDHTQDIAHQYANVEWARWSPGRGLMAARNHWMRAQGCDYFVSLDDDAWFLDGDEVAVAVDQLESRRDVAAVAFDILSPDRPSRVPRADPRATAMFIGCGHVVRVAAVQAVGCYEETPGGYGGEEKDLCLRLLNAGHKVLFLPGVHVWHEKSSLARAAREQHRSGVCNDLVLTLRRTPAVLLPVAVLAKLWRHLMFARANDLLWPCLRGFAWCARQLPAVLRARRPIRIEALREFMRLTKQERSGKRRP